LSFLPSRAEEETRAPQLCGLRPMEARMKLVHKAAGIAFVGFTAVAAASLFALSRAEGALHHVAGSTQTSRHDVLVATICAVGGVALVLSALVLWLGREVLKPLDGLRQRMTEIANGDGDLTRRLDSKRDDEIGKLAGEFDRF